MSISVFFFIIQHIFTDGQSLVYKFAVKENFSFQFLFFCSNKIKFAAIRKKLNLVYDTRWFHKMSVTRGKGKKKLPLKSKMKEVVRFCISDELISCPGMWWMNDCFENTAFFMNSLRK